MEKPSMSEQAVYYLAESRKWSKLLAVFLYILVGFMVLMGLMYLLIGDIGVYGRELTRMIGAFYIIVSLIWLAPAVYLSRFSSNLRLALKAGSEESLTRSFRYLRAHFRFIGIWMIIGVALSVLGIIAAVFAGIFGFFASSGF